MVGHGDPAFLWTEHRNQRNCFSIATDLIPWQPDAIGLTQSCSTVMTLQVLGVKNELAIGNPGLVVISIRIVVCVNRQLTVDTHRLIFLVIKVQPATKSARRLVVPFGHRRLFPNHSHSLWRFVFNLLNLAV